MHQLRLFSSSTGLASPEVVTLAEIHGRPSAVPLVVADGLGVNSTALLIKLKRVGVRPDLILFADTGSEKRETYGYLEIRQDWLWRAGFPELIVVRRRGVRVPDRTLEDQCLRTGTLPSLAYGGKSCSLKWKVAPQNKFCNHWEPALRCWHSGQRVLKAIGYDAGPSDGRRVKEFRDPKYRFWYPLREFGLDRTACIDLIRSEGLVVPCKSACFFCPATKKPELVQLQRQHPDLVDRALAIEERALATFRQRTRARLLVDCLAPFAGLGGGDNMNQRWRLGRSSYRVPDEVINPRDYEVVALRGEREAREFIRTHHYLKSTPPSRWRFGLFRRGVLVGVAVFSHPVNDRSITNVFSIPVTDGVELGRLVLLDEVPGNGESFFVARCFHNLKRCGIAGVVSFSDPVARTAANGTVVAPGHIGTVYKALSGAYLGRSTPRTLRLLPDGQVLSERTLQKLRAGERGTHAMREMLLSLGASESALACAQTVRHVVEQFTRPLRHGGVHKYAWGFTAAVRKQMPPSLPYPEIAPLLRSMFTAAS